MGQVDSLRTGKRFKKTEIGEIPVDWELIDLVDIKDTSKVNSFIDGDWIEAEYLIDEGIRLIQTGNIGEGKFKDKSRKYISEETFQLLNCKEVKPNDILICRMAEPIGRACITPDLGVRMITAVDCIIVKVDTNRFDIKYMNYGINFPRVRKQAEMLSAGSTRQRVSRKNLERIKIITPPLPEQKKIAEILLTVDGAIEKSNEIIEKTKELKKGLMQELLTRGIGHKKFKKTKIGEVPVDWELGTIKNHTAVITKGTTPSTYGHPYTNQGILFIRVENIDKQGHINLKEVKYISEETDKFLSRSRLQAGDILFSIAGALGRVTVVSENLLPANVNQALAIIRLNDNTLNKQYLKYTLQSKIIKTQVNLLAAQLAQANLNLQQVGDIKFPLPNTDEQKKIAEIFSAVDEEIEKETANKEKLEQTKKGLMQVLLTGKKRVKV